MADSEGLILISHLGSRCQEPAAASVSDDRLRRALSAAVGVCAARGSCCSCAETCLVWADHQIQGVVPGLHSCRPLRKVGLHIPQLVQGLRLQGLVP